MKEKWIVEISSKSKGDGYRVLAKAYASGSRRTIDGGRFYASDYGGDKKLAKTAAIIARNKLQEEINLNKRSEQVSYTVQDCYDKTSSLLQFSIKTKERHDCLYRALIPEGLRHKNILKVTTEDVQRSINEYCKTHSQNQVKHAMSVWRQIYKVALLSEIPVVDRSAMVVIPKSKVVEKKHGTIITHENFEKFADELLMYNSHTATGRHRSTAIWYACRIMLHTGLRPQEVYALSRSDIDLNTMQIHVCKSVGSDTNTKRMIIPVKTEFSNATVPISSTLKPILEKLLSWSQSPDLLFLDVDGLPFEISAVSTYVINVSKKCKAKYGFTFNQYMLRHLFSSDLFAANVNPKVIQSLMRHATENMSLYYAYATEEDKLKAIEDRKL